MAKNDLRLKNIVSLIRAELINKPFISAFERISYKASHVKRGDLFIALNHSEINEALDNGAYGIIYEYPVSMSDLEIAWLHVESIHDALIRLLRFYLMQKELKVYHVDSVTFSLFHSIQSSTLHTLEGTIQDNIKLLFSLQEHDTIVYKDLPSSLFTQESTLHASENDTIMNILHYSLFEMSFLYKERCYQNIGISYLLKEYLQKMLTILDDSDVDFRFKSTPVYKHFEPIFINKYFQPVEYGQSTSVIIFETNLHLYVQAYHFLKKEAAYSKLLFLVDSEHFMTLHSQYPELQVYNTESDLVDILKTSSFDFALLFKQSPSLLANHAFNTAPQQLSFF